MTPQEELDAFVPPWQLSPGAWELLKQLDPKGHEVAQKLLELYQAHEQSKGPPK